MVEPTPGHPGQNPDQTKPTDQWWEDDDPTVDIDEITRPNPNARMPLAQIRQIAQANPAYPRPDIIGPPPKGPVETPTNPNPVIISEVPWARGSDKSHYPVYEYPTPTEPGAPVTPPVTPDRYTDDVGREVVSGRTITGAELLRLREGMKMRPADAKSPYGYYENYHIIGSDVPIRGGVYVGRGKREIISVNDEVEGSNEKAWFDYAYSTLQQHAEQRQQAQLKQKGGAIKQRVDKLRGKPSDPGAGDFKNGILTDVKEVAQQLIEFDEEFARQTARQNPDQEVSLAYFVSHHKGVCRHQALLAAYLLERLVNDGKLHGKVSIDRNEVIDEGAHAWVRYTTAAGEVAIIDPTQDVEGRLSEVPTQAWPYARPTDRV